MIANNSGFSLILVGIILAQFVGSHRATHHEDVDASFHEGRDIHDQDARHHDSNDSGQSHKLMPKDKILLSEVKTLTFQRNKRTTSRRTHTIPQLSCVGGTAGCKLFTTDLVECENVGSPDKKTTHINEIQWRCRADISERVRFNHVEVICEGYDYPEDDYILVGSCGLEFTLDYADPHDYHDNSYYKHMDDHEKALHQDRVSQQQASGGGPSQRDASPSPASSSAILTSANSYSLGILILLVAIILTLLVRYFRSTRDGQRNNTAPMGGKPATRKPPLRNYGPLTSAVMTTKKAC